MSLASQRMLLITAIRFAEGRDDLLDIAAVRWQGSAGAEECSVGDLIGWISRTDGHAYLQWPAGQRGPRIKVVNSPTRRHLASIPTDDGHDSLITLPRF